VGEDVPKTQEHETPILGDFNTIAGGFFGGEASTSIQNWYSGEVLPLETRAP